MPTYSFTFPASLAGQRITVFDALGNGVADRVLTASGGQAIADFDLPTGSYEARVDGADGDNAKAVLDDDSIAAGGGVGASETDRGTLYLKASVVDADAGSETWADGSGAPFALVLDTDRQGDSPIPGWADEADGVYSIVEIGPYLVQLGGLGSITYDSEPAVVYVDMYHNDLAGTNYGWAADGTDDSPSFTIGATTTDLPFGTKDVPSITTIDADAIPMSLAGLVGDNYGDTTGNPTVSIEAKLAITKIGAGARFTESDFS